MLTIPRLFFPILPKPSRQKSFSTASTPHITGSKKQSEERAALFAVRVHVIVMCFHTILSLSMYPTTDPFSIK